MPKKPPPTETFATLSANSSCNEPDMSPVTTDDGEDIRLIETIPDPSPNPAQILLHNEHTAEVDHIQNAFEASLAKDRPLMSLFASFRRRLTTPRALAWKLRRTRRHP
jgi:hypothetical protein